MRSDVELRLKRQSQGIKADIKALQEIHPQGRKKKKNVYKRQTDLKKIRRQALCIPSRKKGATSVNHINTLSIQCC